MERGRSEELTAAAVRPFTTMGSATLHLDALQSSRSSGKAHATTATTHRKLASAGAPRAERQQTTECEFDVRKFILEQKGSEPLHQSSLFRAAPFLEQQQQQPHHTKVRASPRSSHSGAAELTKRAKTLLLPKMELGSSKSAGALPDNDESKRAAKAAGGGGASVNQQQDAEYDTVSHFYTIERLAESCCHAVQSRNKTWHFLPGSEERSKGNNGSSSGASGSGNGITGVERPSRRVDVLDLDKCFESAIQFASKKSKWDSDATNEKLAMLDRDLMSIEVRVAHKYAACGASGSSSSASGDDVPLSTAASDKSAESHAALVKLFFAQKWSDIMLGELEAMLTVSFLEQGVLLRKARIQYARAFYALEELFCARSTELAHALQSAELMRQELLLASANHERDTDAMKTQYEGEIVRLSAGFDARKDDMERKVADAKEQMAKMGDTMKTLNTIFRQMREDTEKVKAVELRENYTKLEKKHELCRDELERLRPLVAETQRLAAEKDAVEFELATLKDSVANMTAILAAKDDTITSLMEQQSDMLAAQELQAAQEEELRKRAQDDADDDGDDDNGVQGSSGSASAVDAADEDSPTGVRGRRNSIGVCMRCKQATRELSSQENLADAPSAPSVSPHEVGADVGASDLEARRIPEVRKRRIQCLHFRILLPNLRGRRPQREAVWTFSCMRSILFAKQIDDAMCKRNGGVSPLRIRMPEFVYAWYAPWCSIKDKSDQDEYGAASSGPGGSSDASESESADAVAAAAALTRPTLTPEQQQVQADEDRWCLYYGVKALVHEGYLEAKLFLSLLDEKYGEDELVFMLYCYRVLDILIGGRLHWGPLRECVSYAQFASEYDRLGVAAAATTGDKRVPKTIWISPHHASLATGVVLSKATESERVALDQKIMNHVVTNVPQDERPAVFIPPEYPRRGNKVTVSKHKQSKSATTSTPLQTARVTSARDSSRVAGGGGVEDGEDQASQQFVDANLWVELMMLEYKEEQAHRRAAIRLMFQTATGAASSGASILASRGPEGRQLATLGGVNAATMDMEQFRTMVRTLNDQVPSFMVASLFRNAYVRGGGGVNFDAFMDVAESAQFFSSCMRLVSPAAGVTRVAETPHASTFAALSTSARATHLVDKFFALLRNEVTASVAALPLWARSLTDQLACEVALSLEDSDEAKSDGVRLLTSFHRLVDNLLLAKLVKHEVTGGLFHSKTIFSMERAMTALLECVRLRDRSSVEILVDTVRQKLCVQRMQAVFRAHLRRDFGAPLAMRSLLHCSYARSDSVFRARRAVRPLAWLLLVISAILRQSLRPERRALLVDLSMTSSGFHATSSAAAFTPSSLNGGIGPAPKPVLMELIYDFFLEKFGTRWEAEKLVHDVFVSCRAHVKASTTVMLFSALCSMSNASPDDRLLGQNEALAFLHSVIRCGLHSFSLVNPSHSTVLMDTGGADSTSSGAGAATSSFAGTSEQRSGAASEGNSSKVADAPVDWVPLDIAQTILLGAFSKLSADQKNQLRTRIEEAVLESSSSGSSSSGVTHDTADRSLRSMASSNNFPTQMPPRIEAGAFLLLALTEWKRYVVLRMNEVKMTCCMLEDEMRHFEVFYQLEAIANVLQKCDIMYHSGDVCVIFRRFCSTEAHAATATGSGKMTPIKPSRSNSLRSLSSHAEPVSDRLAAAFFPVLAREPLVELQTIENSASEPFEMPPNPAQSYTLLVSSWNGYREPCRQLLEDLHRVGKNNDIQAESFSHWSPTAQSSTCEVPYLNSSTSSDRLSSQNVAQLEAVYILFLDRMDRLEVVFEKERAALADAQSGMISKRNSFVGDKGDGSFALVDDLHAHTVMVNETWKIFHQVLLGFTRLRALAGLGSGALPDVWTTAEAS